LLCLRGIGGDEDAATVHGTQKPVECMRRPILINSAAGEAVYDPFLGSGTTLIAAETTGRVCLALDIDPRYVDVAVQRWEQISGKSALRMAHPAVAPGAQQAVSA
jgi:DNA modification methylase